MIRVRFAPSPTGLPHVGNIRTAIFNWLFAKSHGGKFILRIEDTDRSRYNADALESIMDSLRWLKIDWDEGPSKGGSFGPYFQSERLKIYHDYAQKLIESGHAYYCDCSPERLDLLRKENIAKRTTSMYDRHCRERNIQSSPEDPRTVIRFKMPLDGKTSFNDFLRGHLSFENSTLDDIVLIKSDGFPTYNYAVVIDDYLMQISHVLRGEEFIPSACKHLLIYAALGWEPPIMIHLPIITGPDRAKLSKRHGASAITEFRDQGILPDAMFNFLALLGWSPKGNLEILSQKEATDYFDPKGLSVSPAVFDIKKLQWMNSEYIKKMSARELTENLLPFYSLWNWPSRQADYLDKVSSAMQKRIKSLVDLKNQALFFFFDPDNYDPDGAKKYFCSETARHLMLVGRHLETLTDWSEPAIEEIVRDFSVENQLGAAKIIHPLRLAVSGLTTGPSLFQIMEIIGKDATIKRIRRTIEFIQKQV